METVAVIGPASPSPAKPGPFDADGDGFGFDDLLDIVNPLQHLPVVSTLYREWTGDGIGAGAKLAGGAIFGGLIGFGASLVNVIVEEATGRDIGETLLAFVAGDERTEAAKTAAATPPPAELPRPQSSPSGVRDAEAAGARALRAALAAKGIDGELGARAALAYRLASVLPDWDEDRSRFARER